MVAAQSYMFFPGFHKGMARAQKCLTQGHSHQKKNKNQEIVFLSSPDHEVLKVSYCDTPTKKKKIQEIVFVSSPEHQVLKSELL